jgi:hypothetical protein
LMEKAEDGPASSAISKESLSGGWNITIEDDEKVETSDATK